MNRNVVYRPTPQYHFNSPPGWPTPPLGWIPDENFVPDESWPEPPANWQWWVADVPAPKENEVLPYTPPLPLPAPTRPDKNSFTKHKPKLSLKPSATILEPAASETPQWYETPAAVLTLSVLVPPVGAYLVWKHGDWNEVTQKAVTALCLVMMICGGVYLYPNDQNVPDVPASASSDSSVFLNVPDDVLSPDSSAPPGTPGDEIFVDVLTNADVKAWNEAGGTTSINTLAVGLSNVAALTRDSNNEQIVAAYTTLGTAAAAALNGPVFPDAAANETWKLALAHYQNASILCRNMTLQNDETVYATVQLELQAGNEQLALFNLLLTQAENTE